MKDIIEKLEELYQNDGIQLEVGQKVNQKENKIILFINDKVNSLELTTELCSVCLNTLPEDYVQILKVNHYLRMIEDYKEKMNYGKRD